jgi:hypothetical protein
MRRQPLEVIALIGTIHLPHPGKSLCERSLKRLIFYGNKLRAVGMPDHEIACMFNDLYWDSLNEARANGVLQKEPRRQ